MAHGLGRLPAVDPRDNAYPLQALLPSRIMQVSRFWATGFVLDQGNTSECVAYAWKQWLDSSPVRDPLASPPDPDTIYREAQKVDEWAGTPHDGTSVRAGAKVMQQIARLGAYHWSTSAEDVRTYLLTTGTVVLGTDWYEGMFKPDGSGRAHLSGPVVGGHSYLSVGWSQARQQFRCENSWGHSWGENGRFWIAKADLQRLLDDGGEACAAAELPRIAMERPSMPVR